MANVIKSMDIAQMVLALDRISRFKFPEKKLKRVYVETICAHLISPSFKKTDIEKFDYESLTQLFTEIWNYSIFQNFDETSNNYDLNKKYVDEEKKCYKLSSEILNLMPNKVDFYTLVKNIKNVPNNFDNYKTPQKIVLTEGITEEILMPVFSKIYGYDWDENYVKIVGIGGKSRILNQYRIFKEQLKIPVFVLMDLDAISIYEQISFELRSVDFAHLVSIGEIEDIIPVNFFKNALNSEYKLQSKISVKDFKPDLKMVENLHNIFKENGFGEFKKSKVAELIKQTITPKSVLSEELIEILNQIKNL